MAEGLLSKGLVLWSDLNCSDAAEKDGCLLAEGFEEKDGCLLADVPVSEMALDGLVC